MARAPSGSHTRVHWLMRVVLVAGAIFSFGAGVQLFILATETHRFFAWTIGFPLTAAFLGGFYWASVVLATLSAKEGVWARARAPISGLFVFLIMMLATTLLHLDKFHFNRGDWLPQAAAWAWLVIYVGYPLGLAVAYLFQRRITGQDVPGTAPLPVWYRATLTVHAAIALASGLALFAFPTTASEWWPWNLTVLTAQAMGSWLTGVSLVLAAAALENDWHRLRIATSSYMALGILQLAAVARFSSDVDLGNPLMWGYVAFFLTAVALGIAGILSGSKFMGRSNLALPQRP